MPAHNWRSIYSTLQAAARGDAAYSFSALPWALKKLVDNTVVVVVVVAVVVVSIFMNAGGLLNSLCVQPVSFCG